MRYLLDVNILLAAIWDSHAHHAKTFLWLKNKNIALSPLSELGFLRVSTQPRGYGFTMENARKGLEKFITDRKATHISADLEALDSHPRTSDQVTDHYLADLALKLG